MMRTSAFIRNSNRSANHTTGTWLCAVALGLALSGFLPSTSQAEQLIYFEPHTGFSEVVDSENPGKYAKSPGPPHAVIRGSGPSRGGNLTFNVTYDDVTTDNDFGFDDVSLGATRRATAEAALTHVNDILNETTGATIDVHFQVSSNAPGSTTLASAGTLYWVSNGFSNGFAFSHITTGSDPSLGSVDISATVNFGKTWNSDQGTPTGGEFDLYSVLLHEFTHGLGYSSLTDSAGDSVITIGENPGKYGVYAQLTERDDADPVGSGSSTAVWTGSGANAGFTGSISDLTGDRLVFVGTSAVAEFGSNPRIYSPSSFLSGNSLSHWDPSVGTAVMTPSIAAGVEKRDYAAFEIGALVDLGYSNATAVGTLDPDNPYVTFGGANGDGSSVSPFNNLSDALSAANPNATIHIAPGTSPEIFTGVDKIDQDVTLQNTTGVSNVVIGSGARRSADDASRSGFVSGSRKE